LVAGVEYWTHREQGEVAIVRTSVKAWLWLIGITLVVLGICGIVGSYSHEATAVWAMDEVMNLYSVGGWMAASVGGLVCFAALMATLSDWYDRK
jgi:hypothetical protein